MTKAKLKYEMSAADSLAITETQIQEAVLAERERCAKIAESKAEECVVQDDEWLACREIAAAIRSGK